MSSTLVSSALNALYFNSLSLLSAEPPACHGDGGSPMEMVMTEEGEHVMVMGGMPSWLFLVAVALVLILSFLLVERIGTGKDDANRFRLDLIKNPTVYRMVKSRWFQAVPQLLMVGALIFLIYAGLFGNRTQNIMPVAVWTIWWAGLVFAVALLGPLFCFACPWDGISNLISRLRLARYAEPISMNLKVPKALRNMYPAIALFVFLTWAELGLGVTTDPRTTAYMAIGMTVFAIGCVLVFKKKAFCAHLCPVGRISGIYANFSPVEVRAKDPDVCASCRTQDCLRGKDDGYPCPTGISLRVVDNATMCTMCTECVKSCDKDNGRFQPPPHRRRPPQREEIPRGRGLDVRHAADSDPLPRLLDDHDLGESPPRYAEPAQVDGGDPRYPRDLQLQRRDAPQLRGADRPVLAQLPLGSNACR